MQHSSGSSPRRVDSRRMLERIDQLESLLCQRQQVLRAQLDTLQGRLAHFGLDSDEKIADACSQLDAVQRDSLQPPVRPAVAAEPSQRAMAYRRIGRLV